MSVGPTGLRSKSSVCLKRITRHMWLGIHVKDVKPNQIMNCILMSYLEGEAFVMSSLISICSNRFSVPKRLQPNGFGSTTTSGLVWPWMELRQFGNWNRRLKILTLVVRYKWGITASPAQTQKLIFSDSPWASERGKGKGESIWLDQSPAIGGSKETKIQDSNLWYLCAI